MYKLTLKTEYGVLTFGMGEPYVITEIQGLSSPDADVNLTDIALADGQRFNSAKVKSRTMNMAFAINYDAEPNRLNAYNVLRVKKPVRVEYKSELRDVFIEGVVKSVNVTHFEMKQICTVTVVCPFPYFKDAQEIINALTNVVNAFHFPFASTEAPQIVFSYIQQQSNTTVINNGEVDTGLIIELYFKGAVENPKIFNYATADFFGLDYNFQAGDIVTINTNQGEKSVKLLRNGAESNLFNYIMKNSKWLQLEGKECVFIYEVGSGAMSSVEITFSHNDLYEGV